MQGKRGTGKTAVEIPSDLLRQTLLGLFHGGLVGSADWEGKGDKCGFALREATGLREAAC